MASPSSKDNEREETHHFLDQQPGQLDHHQRQEASAVAAAPSSSLLQQWTDLVACPPDWLLPSSCSGCLSQVDERGGRNVDGAVNYETLAQLSHVGDTNLLDDNSDESTVESSHWSDRHKSPEETTSIPKNHNDGIEISSGEDRPAPHLALNMAMSQSAEAPSSCLKNRSGTPRHSHRKRIDDLIEKIQSTPTPFTVRNQVLAVHGQFRTAHRNASSSDDDISQSSATSNVQVVQPLSSTLSSPIIARSVVSSPSESESRHSSLALQSPQVRATLTRHRRTKSLPAPPNSPQHISPRSVLDDSAYFESALHHSKKSNLNQPRSPKPHDTSGVCLEGISFADGAGFFSAAIDLDWCCYQKSDERVANHNNIRSEEGGSSTNIKSSEGCGGYKDYGGESHPCTNNSKCQGCIFRRGMHRDNQHEDEEEREDRYYDSDPGHHFAIGPTSNTCHLLFTFEQEATQVSANKEAAVICRRAKHRSRRRKHQSQPKRGSTDSLDSSQDSSAYAARHQVMHESEPEKNLRQQDDQQAYLYGFLSRNHDVGADALQTGFCSTNVTDVRNYVQVNNSAVTSPLLLSYYRITFVSHNPAMKQAALNSRWRLLWHVKNTTKLCDVWIERAYRYNSTEIVEPKLMWRELSQPKLREQRLLGGTTTHPYRVSLFALRRILTVANGSSVGESAQHSQKQLSGAVTNPNSLFLIRSSLREDYMFEASCAEERDHIVHLLKLATARLVSHAVSENGDLMIKEYFNEGYLLEGHDHRNGGGNHSTWRRLNEPTSNKKGP